MKAMLFAAGLGTRLQPLTDDKPKALVSIGGKTLLERSINYLKNNNISEMVINVHHFSQQIKDFIESHDFGIPVHISDETEQLLDTGGGLLKARELLMSDSPILLTNVDILTNIDIQKFLQFHVQSGALATLATRNRPTSRYLLFDTDNQLVGWKNISTGQIIKSREFIDMEVFPIAFSGIQIIEPRLLSLITETGKFSIIDLYLRLASYMKIGAFYEENSLWMDLGKYEDVPKAEQLAKQIDQSR